MYFEFIGSFTLRDEGDGCLSSKYHHADSNGGPFMEACKRIGNNDDGEVFIGQFSTIWLDDNNRHEAAELKIVTNENNTNLFRLTWADLDEKHLFEGTAMRFQDLLVGAYWDV